MKSEDSTNPILIELDHVSRSYGYGEAATYALKDFSLEVRRGEFIMIMGPSGCGKTTLLNVIGLLDQPTSGSYILNGEPLETLSARKKSHIRSNHIGYIFQNFNLIPTLPVIENVALPLIYSGISKTRRLRQASELLATFHLEAREYYYPHQLSGGQQQRVCIARSLVNHPEIILADEPTGNLDSRSSHIVMEELRNIHSEGNTIIMVTHNPQLTTYATRVIHMLDGQIDVDIKTVSDDDLPQITNLDDDTDTPDAAKQTPLTPTPEPLTTELPTELSNPTPKTNPENNPPKPTTNPETKKPAENQKPSPLKKQPIKAPPLGEISNEPMPSRLLNRNPFPVVGSEFLDKSVRVTAKPAIEDLVIFPKKSKNSTPKTARPTQKTANSYKTSKTVKSTKKSRSKDTK